MAKRRKTTTNSKKQSKSGSGGLKQFSLNWKRVVPLVLVVALVGGFMAYRALGADAALALPGAGGDSLRDCSTATGTQVKETRPGNKRNASVCELSNGKTIRPLQFTFRNQKISSETQFLNMTFQVAGGANRHYRACYNVSSVSGSATFQIISFAQGANPGTGTSFTQTSGNYTLYCDPTSRLAGSSLTALRVTSGTVRVSSVGVEQASAPTTPPPAPAPGNPPVVDGKKCSLHLHWAGGGAQPDQRDSNGYWKVWPGSPDGAFWLYDGPHNSAYDPDSTADVAKYNELVSYLKNFLDARECGPVLLIGYSNGGGFAAKLFCKGEDFGGRVWGVIVDDPVMDEGVLGCRPSRNIRAVSFTHSTELKRQAEAAVTGRQCSWDPPYSGTPRPGQGTGWYCENNRTRTLAQYEELIGHKSVLQREFHGNPNGWVDNSHAVWALETPFWTNRF